MKSHLSLSFLLTGIIAVPLALAGGGSDPSPLIREKNPEFPVDLTALEKGQIQYFYEMLDPKLKPLMFDDTFNQSQGTSLAYGRFQSIDMNADGGATREKLGLYTGLMRVAFIVNRSASTFTADEACALPSVNALAKVANKRVRVTSGKEPCQFRLNGAGFVPNQEFRVAHSVGAGAFSPLDSERGEPAVTISQYNFNYGKIFFTKTAQSTSNVVNVYALDGKRSLIESYTVYYIHKLPPKIGGGPDWVRIQIAAQQPKIRAVRENLLERRDQGRDAHANDR